MKLHRQILLVLILALSHQMTAQTSRYPIKKSSYSYKYFIKDKDGNNYPALRFPYKGSISGVRYILWLAEDLRVKLRPAKCYRNNNRCIPGAGLAYARDIAKQACRKLGRGDWVLPNNEDWEALFNTFGSSAYEDLIVRGKSGFNARLNGWYDYETQNGRGITGMYWSSSTYEEFQPFCEYPSYVARFQNKKAQMWEWEMYYPTTCRCVKYLK